jgi:hypothetical protein
VPHGGGRCECECVRAGRGEREEEEYGAHDASGIIEKNYGVRGAWAVKPRYIDVNVSRNGAAVRFWCNGVDRRYR